MQGPLPPTPGTKGKNKERKTATILQDLVKSGVGTLLRLEQVEGGESPRLRDPGPEAPRRHRQQGAAAAAATRILQPRSPTSLHPASRHPGIATPLHPAPCSPPALQQPGRIVCIPTAQHPYGSASQQLAAQIYPRPSPGHGAGAAGTVLLLLRGPGFMVVSALTGKDNSVTTEVVGVILGLLA